MYVLIHKFDPKVLIFIDRSEFHLYQIDEELKEIIGKNDLKTELISVLGSTGNKIKNTAIFKKFNVNTVYHAMTYKHVPLVKTNIIEGIQNNIFDTYEFAKSTIEGEGKFVVLISTDKAVRPTNIMGSKRLARTYLSGFFANAKKYYFFNGSFW